MKMYKIFNEWLRPNRPVVGHLTYRIVPTQKHDTSDAKWRPHFFSLLKVRHFTTRSVVAFMSTDWSFIQRLWTSPHGSISVLTFLDFQIFIPPFFTCKNHIKTSGGPNRLEISILGRRNCVAGKCSIQICRINTRNSENTKRRFSDKTRHRSPAH